ncbi:MAG: DUF4184 family protein [Deinococcota bacterium]
MPFTVSHVAAVIPLNKKPLVLSALIVGSMSPDVLYFVPGVPSLPLAHSLQGLVLFCLPVSFALLLIYLSITGYSNAHYWRCYRQ